MTYWRMQTHPSDPRDAVRYTTECLTAGYIGLDFAEDECHVLLIEPRGVVNTGDAGGALTARNDVWL